MLDSIALMPPCIPDRAMQGNGNNDGWAAANLNHCVVAVDFIVVDHHHVTGQWATADENDIANGRCAN